MTSNAPNRPSRGASIIALIVAVAVPLAIGFAGSLATQGNVDGWYASAQQAPWTPPNEVFGPVWTTLYVLMGVASWLLWRQRPDERARRALRWYGVQLVFNALWTPLFFAGYPIAGNIMLWVALVDILLLLAALVVTIHYARGVSIAAAAILVPLLLWVAYATTLNAYMALMNP